MDDALNPVAMDGMGVARKRCVRAKMNATFYFIEARPAARTWIFTGLYRTCARRTANRQIAFFHQRMTRQIMLFDVSQNVISGPFGERIELYMIAIALKKRQGRAGCALEAFATGDPAVVV